MRKWLWRTTRGTSLILAVLVAVMWVGCLRWAAACSVDTSQRTILVQVWLGYLIFTALDDKVQFEPRITNIRRGSMWQRPRNTMASSEWTWGGIAYAHQVPFAGEHIIEVPLLYPLLLLLFLPTVALVGKLGTRTRGSQLTCKHCGYDLRASTGRCPECGAGIPHHRLQLTGEALLRQMDGE